jgi:hypothetical protein
MPSPAGAAVDSPLKQPRISDAATKKPGRMALSGFSGREQLSVRLLPLQRENLVLDAEFLALQIVHHVLIGKGTMDLFIESAFQ